jgi:TPR repeat protein
MYYQYLITDDVSWLEKSAAAGFSLAQFKLAEQYQRHPKLIANDALRLARIEELYQESADAGLPLALYARVFFGDSTASMAEKRTRLARLADLGHVEAMMEYGHALANMPLRERPAPDEDGSEPPFTNPYGLEKNLPLAYALLKHVQKSMPAPIPPRLPADIHKIEMRMSLEDHEQAKLALAAVESNTPQLFVRLEELIIPGTAK